MNLLNLFWTLVFLGAGLLACAVVVWFVRRNPLFGRDNDYEAREFALLAQIQADLGPAVAKDQIEQKLSTPIRQEHVDTHKPKYRPRPLLDKQAQEIHAVLRNLLGSNPLWTKVDIASLIEQEDVIPPRVSVDFLICRKDFTPAVAILLTKNPADPLQERAMNLLNRNRIRVLCWDASMLPDEASIRRQLMTPKKRKEAA